MTTFIDAHRDEYGVEPICKVLPVAPSTFYEREAHRVHHSRSPARARRDGKVREQIRRAWEENFRVYGVRQVWHQLGRESIIAARCTVAQPMRELGLCGVVRGGWRPRRRWRTLRARRIRSIRCFGRLARTRCPWRTSPTWRRGPNWSMSPSSSTPTSDISWAGGCRAHFAPTWPSTHLSMLCTSAP